MGKRTRTESSATMIAQLAGVVSAWIAYSIWQRRQLAKSVFAAMRLLAETRKPDGDISRARVIADKLETVDSVPLGWYFIAGNPKAKGGRICCAGNVLVCQFDSDGTSFALYGPSPPDRKSLPEILSKRPNSTFLDEDMTVRANYMNHCSKSVKASDTALGTSPFRGVYDWCFRDYVNEEELFGMLAARSCMEILIFYPVQIGRITVDATGHCTLDEQIILFGVIPLQILWEGKISDQGAIAWETTSLRLGWKNFFHKNFEKPAIAERLRQDNWFISYPVGHETKGDIVILHREHRGSLVYVRKK